jgi:hypothetical protein
MIILLACVAVDAAAAAARPIQVQDRRPGCIVFAAENVPVAHDAAAAIDSALRHDLWERINSVVVATLEGRQATLFGSSVADSSLSRDLRVNPDLRVRAAHALASLVAEAGPATEYHARVAALVYRDLSLPVPALRSVIRDRAVPSGRKIWALVALADSADSSWFSSDALVALCTVAGRAEGELRVWGPRAQSDDPMRGVLGAEDRSLLRRMAATLGNRRESHLLLLRRLTDAVGASNPVVEYLRLRWSR